MVSKGGNIVTTQKSPFANHQVPDYGFTAPNLFFFLIKFYSLLFLVSANLVMQVDCLDRLLNAHIVQKFLLAAC
jgi:hypothetical protein